MVRGYFASAVLAVLGIASLVLSGCGPAQPSQPPASVGTSTTSAPPQQARILSALDPCVQGGSGFGRSVCANTTLAALDGQIRTTLASEAASMSEAGTRVLIENQQRWREAQRVACGVSSATAQPDSQQQQCLEQRFRARVGEAAGTVENVGGYLFQQVAQINAAPTPAPLIAQGAEAAITSDIRYPRIDGDQTPQIQRFNALMAQQGPQSDQNSNQVLRYRIAYAGPDLISVRFDFSGDTPGGAQTSTSVKAVTMLMQTGRPLAASDVFRAGSGWEDFVTRRAVRDIAAHFQDYDHFSPPTRDVHETATKPHLWLVTEQGLVILFPPLSFGGSYDMGDAEVTIPWSDLRAYLNPNAPTPIRPQA